MTSKVTMPALLKAMLDQDASDLHISTESPPQLRISGRMVKVKVDPMTPEETKALCYSVLTESQRAEFERYRELDFSFGMRDLARFRGNLMYQRRSIAGVFRRIPMQIPDFDYLKLPEILKSLCRLPNGLILVTGATGSGKSTTLASLIDLINRDEFGHILTIEDPIEFVHQNKNCLVNQREVGMDTNGFKDALKRALRQDPDYVLVGELRDLDTIEMALTMAETGHLVFGTLHTNSAVQSINRIVNVFPPHQQSQIRQLLSFTVQGIVSQQLVPTSHKPGRILGIEVLIPNPAIRNLIREDKIHQIYSLMQTGQNDSGMITMNQSLISHVKAGVVSKADALQHSTSPEEMQKMLAQIK